MPPLAWPTSRTLTAFGSWNDTNLTIPTFYVDDIFLHEAQAGANFLAAADFSFLSYFESLGVKYKEGGVAQDGIQILKNHGINCVRLRLFTSSAAQAANPYNYINNTAIPSLAVRVKNGGLSFSLDFHYSDTWADPGHQAIPAAWANLAVAQLVQQRRPTTTTPSPRLRRRKRCRVTVEVGRGNEQC